ncbi:MAG: hypothetical protein QQN41_11955, partial [Nitrosopumilus sp.]
LVLGCKDRIEISDERFNDIKNAINNIFEALYIEEKLDFVIENYFEFETTLLHSATRHMIFQNQDYDWYQEERHLISRRMANLLSSCRLYIDQTNHNISNIYGEGSDQLMEIKQIKIAKYKSSFSYRLMEALRNYVQHRGFPIHGVKFNSKRTNVDEIEESELLFSITPYIKTKNLESDKKFNKSVAKELKNIGEIVDVKPLIRKFVGGIGHIHNQIRELINDDVKKWEKVLIQSIQQFGSEFGDNIVGLSIAEINKEGLVRDSLSIFTEFNDRRKYLEKKNRLLDSISSRFVTGQIIPNS